MNMMITHGFRLSPQQRHLWALQQGDTSSAYYVQCAILIEGDLDPNILREALETVVRRHEILHTTFRRLPGMAIPVQIIDSGSPPFEQEVEINSWGLQRREINVETAFQETGRRGFDLEKGPLLNVSLFALSSQRHVLIVSLPALCADAITLNNLVYEINNCYFNDRWSEIAEEPLQYADIAEWQNEILELEESMIGKEFWRKQDVSKYLSVKLPFETLAQRESLFSPELHTLTLGSEMKAKLEAMAQSYDSGISDLLLAFWVVLFHRLIGQSEVIVGIAVDGRNYPQLKKVFGLFTRYLPVCCRLADDLSVGEMIEQVKELTRAAIKWQECFTWDDGIGADGSENKPQFFPIGFEVESQPAKFSTNGTSFTVDSRYVCVDKFKIKLSCLVTDDSLKIGLHYDSNLIPATYIGRLAGHIQAMIENAVAHPISLVGELEMLSEAERQQLLDELNNTKYIHSQKSCVHQLFESQVGKRPDSIAVVFEDQWLTFAELNTRANQLARHLRRFGVGPEICVGICLNRCVEMITGLIGALKAGGAYVPLDPLLPKDRLAFILKDTRAKVLLSSKRLVDTLPEHEAAVVCLDTDWEIVACESAENLPSHTAMENLIYVIFTSGSTGNPKGVGVEQRQLINYYHAILSKIGLDEGASYALISTLAADLGNTMIYPSLCHGGRLYIISEERAYDAKALAAYLGQSNIDCLKITPSHLTTFLAPLSLQQTKTFQRLFLGGEASSWELIEDIRKAAPQCLIFNHYGPTETTIGALTYQVGAEPDHIIRHAPLGRPLANMQVYLLDTKLRLTPTWIIGELYIGGAGVSRGYINRPDITAERFIPHPYTHVELGARFYKTGDLAKYSHSGNIEFIGRSDRQVKISGYRIELGDVESALNQHPAVRKAIATTQEDLPESKRLVAYLQIEGQSPLIIDELREFLMTKLPAYMIPSVFVTLDTIPLTPNGKINFKALPKAQQTHLETAEYAEPFNEIEEILAVIWQKILGVNRVGVHDDYFSLGGDSIRAVQIVYEMSRYNLPLTAMDIFQHRTIHQLALITYKSRGATRLTPPLLMEPIQLTDDITSLLPDGIEDVYPASKMQQFVLFHYLQDRQKMGVYHIQHLYRIYDENPSLTAFQEALKYLVCKHPALRTAFILPPGGEPLQVVRKKMAFSVRVEDLRELGQDAKEDYINEFLRNDRANLFDLTNLETPPFRFAIFLTAEKTLEFFMSIHHSLTDGWGNRELAKGWVELYLAYKRGENREAIIPRANTCKEFVILERESILSREARDFWSAHLQGCSPTIISKMPIPDASSETNHFQILQPELTGRIREMSRELRVSLKALFLSAYLDLVSLLTGEDEVTVGVVSNGRTERLTEALTAVGLFWNIVPFRRKMEPADKLAKVRNTQQLLVEVERFAQYPLSQMMEDQQKTELFFSTFNFLHFHNITAKPSDSALRIAWVGSHDKFHFPLNYIISVSPVTGNVGLRMEYDKSYLSHQAIETLAGNYVELLKHYVEDFSARMMESA
jgi:amino acid adenylation domain-containing protein